MKRKQQFLLTGVFLIAVIAAGYGASPQWFAQTFLGIAELDVNFAHILRAIMVLYLAFGAFWLFAAFNPKYQNTAVLTVLLLSASLLLGRLLSIYVDGIPSPLLVAYTLTELAIIPLAWWIYQLPE